MSRVTLQSIADHLGISKFAVSRALAGKSGVSEDTRRTILTTAEQFGYLVTEGGVGNVHALTGRAVTSHDGGKTWA